MDVTIRACRPCACTHSQLLCCLFVCLSLILSMCVCAFYLVVVFCFCVNHIIFIYTFERSRVQTGKRSLRSLGMYCRLAKNTKTWVFFGYCFEFWTKWNFALKMRTRKRTNFFQFQKSRAILTNHPKVSLKSLVNHRLELRSVDLTCSCQDLWRIFRKTGLIKTKILLHRFSHNSAPFQVLS